MRSVLRDSLGLEAIAADPTFADGHADECAACQAYRTEMQALDKVIGRALRLDVPPLAVPELEDIETTNVVSLQPRRLSPPTWIAIAASVVIAVLLGVRMIGSGIEYESLADEILAHLDHEPYALRVTDVAVADARLARVVPAKVAELDHSAGLITYAQTCVINGREVPHLVIQGERGPVTILLLPEEMVSAPQELAGESINGVILPVGDGSIAIIGERDESLGRIEQEVLKSVRWST